MDNETRLNQLFAEYRESLPDIEGSAQFVPGLWARIEARRTTNRWFAHIAQAFVTAAAVLSLLLALVLIPRYRNEEVYQQTYVDALVDADSADSAAYAAVLPHAQHPEEPGR
jgi:hypothetical protein